METRYLSGFIDSNDFVIMDGIPHYRKIDNTYLNVFKSGLSLDDIIDFDNIIEMGLDYTIPKTTEYEPKPENKIVKHIYDVNDITSETFPRKTQKKSKTMYRLNKKKSKKNSKNHKKSHKNIVRVYGNDWKRFNIEQEYGEKVDLESLRNKIAVKRIDYSFLDKYDINYLEENYDEYDEFDYTIYDDDDAYENYMYELMFGELERQLENEDDDRIETLILRYSYRN